jgi:Hemolysins and related proteins containing CBS domains
LGFDIFIIFILFLLSGFFSSAEASLFSLTDLHLHKMKLDNYPFASFVDKLLENPQRLLITIVASNEAVNIVISILAASFFIGLFGADGQWVSIIFTSMVLLIAGEAIPKTFGVTYPMQISSTISPLLTLISRLGYPVVAILEKASGFIKYSRVQSHDDDVLMEDEFKTLVHAGKLAGVVDESQKELINRIFELGDKPVTDIMIPRVEMFCLPINMPVEEIIGTVVKERHERIPIYTDDRDDIAGILLARDLLTAAGQGRQASIEKILIRPYFVPEGKTVNGLLHDFKENRMQIAIVVDEYGGVSGLVTVEDILGHLFEEPYSGSNPAYNDCERIDESTIIVPGKMPMEQFNNLMQTQMPQEEFDTIGGFVLHLFGKLPVKGEEVSHEGYTFLIENVGRARILKIRISSPTGKGANQEA